MFRSARYFIVALLAVLASATFAQEPLISSGDLIYTFDESGVSFTVPAGGELDTSGAVPAVTVDGVLIQMIEPSFIGVTAEDTADAPLTGIMDYLLGLVGYGDERTEDENLTLSLQDGREAAVFDFINDSGDAQSMFVLRLSNTQVAAMNIRSNAPLTGEQQTMVLALALSFDSPIVFVEPTPTTDPVAELTAELTESFTYPSGTTFSYSPDFQISAVEDVLRQLNIFEQITITMVDPAVVGMPAGEAMDDVIGFAVGSSGIDPASFEALDIGGREAVVGSASDGFPLNSLALVRFDDGTVGIMDIQTPGALTNQMLLRVRQIAASYNSASSEFTGTSQEAAERADALFEQAMQARDAEDFEGAIALFDQALEFSDGFPLAYYWRGLTYREIGDLESALSDLRQAKEMEPGQAAIQTALAEVYVLADNIQSALTELEAVAAAQGSEASEGLLGEIDIYRQILAGEMVTGFFVNRAERLNSYGLHEGAVRDMQAVIAFEPDNWEWHARLGNVYKAAGDYREAIRSYTDALELERLAILFYNRGVAYRDAFGKDARLIPDALLGADNNYRCSILLADALTTEGSTAGMTEELLDAAQRAINTIIISDEDYEPITDPALCVP